jgi:endoglucanase
MQKKHQKQYGNVQQKKKITSLFLTGVMALSLAGCSFGTSSGKAGKESPSDKSEGMETSSLASTAGAKDSNQNLTDSEQVNDLNSAVTSEEGSSNISGSEDSGLKDGDVLVQDDFEDGEKEGWGTYTSGGKFELFVENGELVADITKPGDLEYSCQFYRDGISLNNGCVYDVSFDIRSDLDRSILWRYQINGGDYHAYYEEEDRIGTKTKHISARFRMEEASDPAPRLCFNVGSQGDLDAGTPNKIYLDNFTMTVADASEAMAIESLPEAKNVKVNQLGYNINDVKTVVCKYNRDLDVFEIHDAGTDEVVYSGTLSHEFTNSK